MIHLPDNINERNVSSKSFFILFVSFSTTIIFVVTYFETLFFDLVRIYDINVFLSLLSICFSSICISAESCLLRCCHFNLICFLSVLCENW